MRASQRTKRRRKSESKKRTGLIVALHQSIKKVNSLKVCNLILFARKEKKSQKKSRLELPRILSRAHKFLFR